MSRSSSLSGLGRGRARGRRDIAEDEQLAERRQGRFRVEDWEGELAGTQSDAESKWITMEYNAPSPYVGYMYRLNVYLNVTSIFVIRIQHFSYWVFSFYCLCHILAHVGVVKHIVNV